MDDREYMSLREFELLVMEACEHAVRKAAECGYPAVSATGRFTDSGAIRLPPGPRIPRHARFSSDAEKRSQQSYEILVRVVGRYLGC